MIAVQVDFPNRLLVVDDSESNLYVISTWLRRAGYDVIEARLGADALQLLDSMAFDMAILDVNLPDMTGYAICEHIKEKNGSAVPVLHISSTAITSADRSEGLRRGAEGYLVEPVEREELLATVEALLRAVSAQKIATRLSTQLRRLNEATDVLNNAAGPRALTGSIAEQASILFDTPAGVAIVAEDGAEIAHSTSGTAAKIPAGSSEALANLLAAARTSERVDAALVNAAMTHLPDTGAYFCADITGERAGYVFIHLPNLASYSADDAAVFSAFARAASTALRNTRSYDTERRIALKLQENLLPRAASSVAGLELVTRYAAGAAHVEVGGDFYEVFPLDEHRVVIAIGDVVGHSLEAAAIMAQLRTAIRCFSVEGHAPDAVLDRLNRVLMSLHPDKTATVCLGIYDAATGDFTFANAGHVPPLHHTGGSWSLFPLGGTLLGIEGPPVPLQRAKIARGDTLVFYTDGLVERRGESIDEGLLRLLAAAARHERLADICDGLLREAGTGIEDDIAIAALRRT